jgi:hypothetical protein
MMGAALLITNLSGVISRQRNNAKKKHVSTVYATVPWLAFLFFSPVALLMKKNSLSFF